MIKTGNEELHDLYSLPNIQAIKPRNLGWQVWRIGEE
jgi:hypothetical protein